MTKRIITISREFGSGGRSIGRKLADELNYKYYDKEIIGKIAEESGLSKSYIAKIQDSSTYKGFFNIGLLSRDQSGKSIDDYIWEFQKNVIEELGNSNENIILVGRCGNYILKNRKDAVHLFIHSDIEKRMERVKEKYGEREESLEKRLRDKDNKRKIFCKYYTDTKWGDSHNYTMTLNSGVLREDGCVKMIKELIKL